MENKRIKALIALLDDEDQEVVDQVENELTALGEDVIPFLESAWEENFNPVAQKRIEELIHGLQFDLLKKRLLAWKERGGEDLLEGVWLVATYQYPDLELDEVKASIDQIYYDVWVEQKNNMHPYDQVKSLNNVLFNKMNFSANTKNFHSPANSMINTVLESRKGNPISLCVVYMLVAQKLNLPIYGVNLPNLFVLTYKGDNMQFYINAFNKGLILTREDIDNYVEHLKLTPRDIFYEPCSNFEVIKRVFRNLMVSFDKLGETDKVQEVRALFNTIVDDSGEQI